MDSEDFKLFLSVIGPTSGKTSVLSRLADDTFPSKPPRTMKRSYKNITKVIDGFQLTICMYDTPGDKKFFDYDFSFLSSAHGIVFMFDITSMESFEFIQNIVAEVKKAIDATKSKLSPKSASDFNSSSTLSSLSSKSQFNSTKSLSSINSANSFRNSMLYINQSGDSLPPTELDPFMLLVGNKLDLDNQRLVSEELAQELADKYNMWYYEISAQSGEGCQEAFTSIIRAMLYRERHRTKKPFQDIEDINYKIIQVKKSNDDIEDGKSLQVVKAASFEKLIDKLLDVSSTDTQFQKTFMLTYRSFISPIGLFEEFVKQFNNAKTKSFKLRVINLIKFWISNFPLDFNETASGFEPETVAERKQLKESLLDFCKVIESFRTKLSKMLLSYLNKETSYTASFSEPPPKVHAPKKNKFSFLDLDPVEVARQITLIEYKLFSAIEPREFLGLSWSKKNKEINSPNIVKMISFSNKITKFYLVTILNGNSVKKCSESLKHILKIFEELYNLNNFNGMFEVLSCIKSSAIHRMQKTLDHCKSLHEKFIKHSEVMNSKSNFKAYRDMLHTIDKVCVPYLGIYLTDLTFIEEGNKDNVSSSVSNDKVLINFEKRRMVASVILEVQQYQQSAFNLTEVPLIKEFLLADMPTISEEVAYDISLKIEPRKK